MTTPIQPKMCPILTAASLRSAPKTEPIVTLHIPGAPTQQAESEAVMCVGKECMWFVDTQDGGRCAMTLIPSQIAQTSMMLQNLVQVTAQSANLSVIPNKPPKR